MQASVREYVDLEFSCFFSFCSIREIEMHLFQRFAYNGSQPNLTTKIPTSKLTKRTSCFETRFFMAARE